LSLGLFFLHSHESFKKVSTSHKQGKHSRKNSYKDSKRARHFMLLIPVLRRQRSERSRFKAKSRQIVCEILV
jgi:hypothetical protein